MSNKVYIILTSGEPTATAETRPIAEDIKKIMDKCFPRYTHKIVSVDGISATNSFNASTIAGLASTISKYREAYVKSGGLDD